VQVVDSAHEAHDLISRLDGKGAHSHDGTPVSTDQ